jgi:hypothetical protein
MIHGNRLGGMPGPDAAVQVPLLWCCGIETVGKESKTLARLRSSIVMWNCNRRAAMISSAQDRQWRSARRKHPSRSAVSINRSSSLQLMGFSDA